MVRELDWNKAKVSLTASGKQPYTRDDVNEVAEYLNLHPHEMLMHPDEAMRLRALRAEMARLGSQIAPTDESDGETRAAKVVSLG